jgi:hypothetical protein
VKSRPPTPQAAAVAALELAAYCPGIARPNGLLEQDEISSGLP